MKKQIVFSIYFLFLFRRDIINPKAMDMVMNVTTPPNIGICFNIYNVVIPSNPTKYLFWLFFCILLYIISPRSGPTKMVEVHIISIYRASNNSPRDKPNILISSSNMAIGTRRRVITP